MHPSLYHLTKKIQIYDPIFTLRHVARRLQEKSQVDGNGSAATVLNEQSRLRQTDTRANVSDTMDSQRHRQFSKQGAWCRSCQSQPHRRWFGEKVSRSECREWARGSRDTQKLVDERGTGLSMKRRQVSVPPRRS